MKHFYSFENEQGDFSICYGDNEDDSESMVVCAVDDWHKETVIMLNSIIEKLRIEYGAELEAFKSVVTSEKNEAYELLAAATLERNNLRDEVNNQFNHLAEKHDEISNLAQELEHYKICLGKMTNLMLDRDEQIERLRTRYNDMETRWMAAQAKYSNKLESDIMERMKTLEEVCQYVAKEIGYEDWDQVDCIGETMLKKIVQLYGYEQAKKHAFELKTFDDDLNKAIGRANALEEWLTEYRDQLKKENAYHKNTGIINDINELLNGE